MNGQVNLVPMERIERAIILVRGEKVMLDNDLAEIYGVETKALNRAVKRNENRFPPDFMFQLTIEEAESLRCQTGTSNEGRGGRRYLPYAFTEHGALMLANVLNSERAAQTSVQVVRTFVRLRQMLASNAELARKLEALEQKYDAQFKVVFEAIRHLMSPPEPKRREIGFHVKYDDDKPRARSGDRHDYDALHDRAHAEIAAGQCVKLTSYPRAPQTQGEKGQMNAPFRTLQSEVRIGMIVDFEEELAGKN